MSNTKAAPKPRRSGPVAKTQQHHQGEPIVKRAKTGGNGTAYKGKSMFNQGRPHHSNTALRLTPPQDNNSFGRGNSPQQQQQQQQQQPQQHQQQDDPIAASILAVFPNWQPEDPSFLKRHGFSDSDAPLPTPRTMSSLSSNSSRSPLSAGSPSSFNPYPHSNGLLFAPPPLLPFGNGRRNAEHNLPEIVDGPYSEYLDRYGGRPEYFPHDMLRLLDGKRKGVTSNGYNSNMMNNNNAPLTPPDYHHPLHHHYAGSSPGGTTDPYSDSHHYASPPAVAPETVYGAPSVYVVMHTQQGGYYGRSSSISSASSSASSSSSPPPMFGASPPASNPGGATTAQHMAQQQHRQLAAQYPQLFASYAAAAHNTTHGLTQCAPPGTCAVSMGRGNGGGYAPQQGGMGGMGMGGMRGIGGTAGPGMMIAGNDEGFRVRGVFTTLEKANVRAMELFRKQYRDFMLTGPPPSEEEEGEAGKGGKNNNNNNANNNNNNSGGNAMNGGAWDGSSFPQQQQQQQQQPPRMTTPPGVVATGSGIPFVRSRNCEAGPAGAECWAGWWVDSQGCLVLRAVNWGSGDAKLVVVRQDLIGA